MLDVGRLLFFRISSLDYSRRTATVSPSPQQYCKALVVRALQVVTLVAIQVAPPVGRRQD